MTLNLTHAECLQRGNDLQVHDYRVELDLRGAGDLDRATFRATTTITFTAATENTWVDLVAESVTEATLNGHQLDVAAYDGARLPVNGLQTDNEVTIVADLRYSRTGEGLHRFTDPQDGRTYLYTHLEPTDTRRLFACFEQPDLKARFTFVVSAPSSWHIVSGAPEAARVVEGEYATVTFAPTPPQSSYITAVAAGPYHRQSDRFVLSRADGSTQTIELGMLCRRSMAAYAQADEIFRITKDGLAYFDEAFGYPYPWGKYDQVFVPEYNLGAMENPGLVTFTESFLHRGRATGAQHELRAEVIMHEMSHMWFGDLATPRWWNDTWLKESFADLMGYQVAAEAAGFAGAWIQFALGRKQWAYVQDERPTTHPIEAVIDDLQAARQNFDGITYAKGAAVMKQLQAYVGKDAFFAGARAYFAEHAFGSTTLADLLGALAASSGRDLGPWGRLWLQTAGPSVLTPQVERDGAGRVTALSIEQHAVDRVTGTAFELPHRLRVGMYRLDDDRLARAALLDVELDGRHTRVPDVAGYRADLVLVNDDDLTYAIARLDEHSARLAAGHVSSVADPLSRSLIWSSLWNMVRHQEFTVSEFVEAALVQLPAETNSTLLATVIGLAHAAVTSYTAAADREKPAARLVEAAWRQLRVAEAGSDLQLVWARALGRFGAISGARAQLIEGLIRGTEVIEGLAMDPDLRWLFSTALAAQGIWGEAELDQQLRLDATMSGQIAHEQALAGRPGAAVKEQVWQMLTGDTSLTNDRQRALLAGFAQPASSDAASAYTGRYFASLTDWWQSMPQTMATRLVQGLFPPADLGASLAAGASSACGDRTTAATPDAGAFAAHADPERHPVIQAATDWLTAHPDAEPALRRTVTEALDDAARALRCQAHTLP